MQAVDGRFVDRRRRALRSHGPDHHGPTLEAVRAQVDRQHTGSRLGRLEDGRASTVGEQDRGGPVLVVDDVAEFLGTHQQDPLGEARLDHPGDHRGGVDEARAGGVQVKGGGVLGAQALLQHGPSAGTGDLRGEGGHHDQV